MALRFAPLILALLLCTACSRAEAGGPAPAIVPVQSTAGAPRASSSNAPGVAMPPEVAATATRASKAQTGDAIDQIMAGMSLEEKLGQMLIYGVDGSTVTPAMQQMIEQWHVGNLVLISSNTGTASETRALTSAYQQIAEGANDGIGMLIAADEEGGQELALTQGFNSWPYNVEIGQTGSADYAAQVATGIAGEMKSAGINMNLAPVVDVNDIPNNPIIGPRSYGPDPALDSTLGAAAIRAYQAAGIIATAKHFPGHGHTDADSHLTRPVVDRTAADLERIDLAPFRAAIAAGVDAIMTAHVLYPALDPSLPATLSPAILTGILRGELGFEGVIVTDDFNMQGVLEGYGAGPAAVLAVQAGADVIMVLGPGSRRAEVHAALLDAVQSGAISMDRINASVRRVLALKLRYGLVKGD